MVFLSFFFVQTLFWPKRESEKLPCDLISPEQEKFCDHALRLASDFLPLKSSFWLNGT